CTLTDLDEFNVSGGASVLMEDCFTSGLAGFRGASIEIRDSDIDRISTNSDSVVIERCSLTGRASLGEAATVTECQFENGFARFTDATVGDSTFRITQVEVQGSAVFSGCDISGASWTGRNAAVLIRGSVDVRPVFRRTQFHGNGNSTTLGGAVSVLGDASPLFENCLFFRNTARFGGAIYAAGSSLPRVVNCTITGNAAQRGGGIHLLSTIQEIDALNCILWGNSGGTTHNVREGVRHCIVDATDLADRDANRRLEPRFVGGDARFIDEPAGLELLANSPAIDFGSTEPSTTPLEDFVGVTRPCHDEIDAGAYEFCGERESEVPVLFRRGDVNGDARVDISDSIAVLSYLFLGAAEPPCLDAADVDDSGTLDLTDGHRINLYLFLGGAPPLFPGPAACGRDESLDELSCFSFSPCS
ncbi:MAG: right-handed parallel beta-helix repeat-containing protein, partial [Planctomycetota bacterium]